MVYLSLFTRLPTLRNLSKQDETSLREFSKSYVQIRIILIH